MKPLSVIAFLRGSFSKMLPMIITVSLCVAILYFLAMFSEQLDMQSKETSIYTLENMSLVLGDKTGISKDDMKNIAANSGDSKIFGIGLFDIKHHAIVGGSSPAYILMLEQKDIIQIMELKDFKLVEGHLPQKPKEIILHKKLALDYGLKPGSIVEKNTEGWFVNAEVKIVGIFEGRGFMGIGMEDKSLLQLGDPYVSLAIFNNENSLKVINKYIEKNFSEKYRSYTIDVQKSLMDKNNGSIAAMKLFIGIVLVCVIGVFLVNITTIQYSVRKKELELLHAIGYTRKYVLKKSLKEIGIAAFIGYLGGILLAIAIGWGINICFLSEKGMDFTLILTKSMLTMLLVPLAIVLISMRAPLKQTKLMDLV